MKKQKRKNGFYWARKNGKMLVVMADNYRFSSETSFYMSGIEEIFAYYEFEWVANEPIPEPK